MTPPCFGGQTDDVLGGRVNRIEAVVEASLSYASGTFVDCQAIMRQALPALA
jgi:hypothetical protein